MLFTWKWPALATIAGVAALLAFQNARDVDKEPANKAHASKLDLTPESMPKLFALVRPQATEWRHLKVQWMTEVVAARKLIVICYTGGAGYNEPLGIC